MMRSPVEEQRGEADSLLSAVERCLEAARQAIYGGRYREAVERVDEGLTRVGQLDPSSERERLRLGLLLTRGRARVLGGDYAALSEFEVVQAQALDPVQRIEAGIGLADCYSGTGEYEAAERGYSQALEEAQAGQHHLCSIRCWIGLGALLWKQGRVEEGVRVLRRALDALRRTPNVYELGHALLNLGVAHSLGGQLAEALTSFEEALKCFRASEDDHRTAAVLNNLGELHQELRDLERAMEFHQEAASLAAQAGEGRIRVDVIRNLGVDLLLLGRYTEAMARLNEALSAARQIGDKDLTLQALYSLGDAYLRQGEVERAMAVASELAAEAEVIRSELHVVRARLLEGRVYLARGEYQAAQAVLQDALTSVHSLPSRTLLWQLHAALGRASADPQVAQVHFRIAADLIRQTAEPLPSAHLRARYLGQAEVQAVLQGAGEVGTAAGGR